MLASPMSEAVLSDYVPKVQPCPVCKMTKHCVCASALLPHSAPSYEKLETTVLNIVGDEVKVAINPRAVAAAASRVMMLSKVGASEANAMAVATAAARQYYQRSVGVDATNLVDALGPTVGLAMLQAKRSEILAYRLLAANADLDDQLADAKTRVSWLTRTFIWPIRQYTRECMRSIFSRSRGRQLTSITWLVDVVWGLFGIIGAGVAIVIRRLWLRFVAGRRLFGWVGVLIAALLAQAVIVRRLKLWWAQARLAEISEVYNNVHFSWGGPIAAVFHGSLVLHKVDQEAIVVPPEYNIKIGTLYRVDGQRFSHDLLCDPVALPVVPASSPNNELNGLIGRQFGNELKEDPNSLGQWCNFFDLFAEVEMKEMIDCPQCSEFQGHDATTRAWNSVERFPKQLVEEYNELLLLADQGVYPNDNLVTAFVKQELYGEKALVGRFAAFPCRIIQTVTRQAHAALGPFFYAFGKKLARVWGPQSWITYASGLTPLQAAADLAGYGVYYVGDVSRFDRSLSPGMLSHLLSWRLANYETGCLTTDQQTYMQQQLQTTGRTMKGRHKYKFDGQRRSGDANTSCDNTLLNVITHLWAVFHYLYQQDENGSSSQILTTMKSQLKVVALGDDIVVAGPQWLANVPFKAALSNLGWKVKPKFVTILQDVEFCSRLCWSSTLGPIFATRPGRFFQRFPFSVDFPSKADPKAKAYCSYLDNRHVPFVRQYLLRVCDILTVEFADGNVKWPDWAFHMDHDYGQEPDDQTWQQLYEQYGLTQADEQQFAQQLKKWAGGPAVWENQYVRRFFEVEGLLDIDA